MASGERLEVAKVQGEKSDRDWTSLTADILHRVLGHQLCFPDYVRNIAAACPLWRRATVPAELRSSFPKLLLLASTPSTNPEGSRRSLFTADRKPFHGAPCSSLHFPPPFLKRCCGSSFGWLAVATHPITKKANQVALGVTLLNPFTGATIRLPPILLTDRDDDTFQAHDEYLVSKVVLSADPATAPDTFEAVAICGGMMQLAYYKSGATKWAYVSEKVWVQVRAESKSDENMKRVVCFDALHYRGKFCVLSHAGWVFSIEPGDSLELKSIVPGRRHDGGSLKQYIVESSTGDLLVARLGTGVELNWNMVWKIFKVIDSRSGRTCDHEEVKSLGDDALFVGTNRSLALPVSAEAECGFLPGCRPNCIYFTGDGDGGSGGDDDDDDEGGLEMSCCSLDHDITEEWHYEHGRPATLQPPPIWIEPNFEFGSSGAGFSIPILPKLQRAQVWCTAYCS